jgi:hypothetical protein
MKFPSIITPNREQKLIEVSDLAFEMREQVFNADGKLVFDSEYYMPNALTNDGQAHMLNVWAREQANLSKYLFLLNMAAGTAPTKTSTLATITEAVTINTNGYARQNIAAGDWGAPALDSGDQQITAAQKTFGPFTGNVPVSHVALASVASTFTGTLFLYVSTAYHTANAASRTFVNGESYLVTLRDKQT